jgi:CubicO group peptidase (beta-lactamase class C family)
MPLLRKPRRWPFVVGLAVCSFGWLAFVLVATLYGWWRQPLAPTGEAQAFAEAVVGKIKAQHRGNVVFVLIQAGKPVHEYTTSVREPVDRDTLFQVASLSKWVSAWGVMTLVEAGKLDLDKPVTAYLKRWKLPKGEFDNDAVTVRRLLSHTAGLTDGLGYGGFLPGTAVQSLEDSLTRASDASPNADGRVRVGMAPGTKWRYSGGGYTLLQLIVEEVSGESFESYMSRAVFQPLGMSRSTYSVGSGVSNVATFFDAQGAVATHYRFTSLAATSLYTSAADMTRFVAAHVRGPSGEAPGRGVLAPATLALMRRPHASQYGIEIWGLGTMLYAPNGSGDFLIGHDGNNEPAVNTAVRLDPATGDGIVILETGNRLLATEFAGEWVYWKTRSLDFLAFMMAGTNIIRLLAGGWVVLLVITILLFRTRRQTVQPI